MMPSLWISRNQLLGFFELHTEAGDVATHLKSTFAKHPSPIQATLVTVTAFSFFVFETQDYSQMYLSQWFSLRIDHLGCLLLLFVCGVSVSGTSRLENYKTMP